MRLVVPRRALLDALRAVAVASQARATMPALTMVQLRARPDGLAATCTDLFRHAVAHMPADVRHAGASSVDVVDLAARVETMPEGPLELTSEADDTRLVVAAGKRRHVLHAVPGEDFPGVPQMSVDPSPIDGQALAAGVRRVQAAVSADLTRPALSSLLVAREGERVLFVATDGHRLHVARVALEVDLGGSWLVPRAFLRQLAGCGDGTTVRRTATHVEVAADGVTHGCKLVDAEFPPYAQVIPQRSPHTATVDRAELMAAVRSVSLAASGRTGAVRLTFREGVLALRSESPDAGESSDEVAADGHEGKPSTVTLNASYLLDACAGVDGERVAVSYATDLDPILVRDEAAPDAFVAVVMPMRGT